MEEFDNKWLLDILERLKEGNFVYNDSDFCRQTGIPKTYLSDMKSGRRAVSEQTVRKIRQAFPSFFGGKMVATEREQSEIGSLIALVKENNRRCNDQIDRIISLLEKQEGVGIEKEKAMSAVG